LLRNMTAERLASFGSKTLVLPLGVYLVAESRWKASMK
jgi:hypothetical protein